MNEHRKLRVFLCHASQDKPIVRELYQRLLAEGWIDPWLDEEKLLPGQDWGMEIEKAVESADAVIVCLSNNSVTKEGYVQRELRFALEVAFEKPEGAIFVIPLKLEICQVPRKLHSLQYIDFHPDERKGLASQRVIMSLERRASDLGILNDRRKLTSKNWHGMEFVYVPPGDFLMGTKEGEIEGWEGEKPQHLVRIPYAYWIGRFTVTNEQFALFVNSHGMKHPISDWKERLRHPVVGVACSDAMYYCQWLNEIFQLSNFSTLEQLVVRLPTEAEWEKAARGTDGRIYPWGNKFDPLKCNSKESGIGITTPVGAYSPIGDSPYGVADVAGNVWEWTHSLYRAYPYNRDDGREDESVSGNRVLRGGSFIGTKEYLRCTCRDTENIFTLFESWGFRVVIAPQT